MIRIEVDNSELRKGIERLVELGNKGERVYMPLCRIAGIVDITAMFLPLGKTRSAGVAFSHRDDWEGNIFNANIYDDEVTVKEIIGHISGLLADLEDIYIRHLPPEQREPNWQSSIYCLQYWKH